MPLLILLLVPLALALSAGLGAGLTRLGHRLRLVDAPGPDHHKRHARAIPNVGGIAITFAVLAPLLAGLLLVTATEAGALGGWLAPLAPHRAGIAARAPEALALAGAMLLFHGLGLVDDRRDLGPGLKLLVEGAVVGVLVLFFDLRALHALGTWWGAPGEALSIALSILWILGLVNALNFLDNMDGLAAGTGAVIAGLYLLATLALPVTGGQWFDAALAALLLGALAGFLPHNYPRARLFMGDGGSLVIGLALAVLSLRTTYLPGAGGRPLTAWHALLAPLALMAIPLYDLASVTLLRLMHRRSPLRGDRNHFSHRLVRKGLAPPVAVAVIWLATLAAGLSGVLLPALGPHQALIAGAQALAVLAILALLELSSPGRATTFGAEPE